MKAVLMSIRPEWCEKIANGKKLLEIRKTRPKLETPFKVYIYCTKASPALCKDGSGIFATKNAGLVKTLGVLNGKVIGEFVCDYIVIDKSIGHNSRLYAAACMSAADIASYCTNAEMYGWHISQLQIYDKPKKLEEFSKPCIYGNTDVSCFICERSGYDADMHINCFNKYYKPPQSWGYTEE